MVGEYKTCQVGQVAEHIISGNVIGSQIILVVFISAFYNACSADVESLQILQTTDEFDICSVEVTG